MTINIKKNPSHKTPPPYLAPPTLYLCHLVCVCFVVSRMCKKTAAGGRERETQGGKNAWCRENGNPHESLLLFLVASEILNIRGKGVFCVLVLYLKQRRRNDTKFFFISLFFFMLLLPSPLLQTLFHPQAFHSACRFVDEQREYDAPLNDLVCMPTVPLL